MSGANDDVGGQWPIRLQAYKCINMVVRHDSIRPAPILNKGNSFRLENGKNKTVPHSFDGAALYAHSTTLCHLTIIV